MWSRPHAPRTGRPCALYPRPPCRAGVPTISMNAFTELGVPRKISDALAKRGIASPFPIQALTIADAMAGRDLCGRAPTGSGKTLAFGIPLAALAAKGSPRRPSALVLVPTRELA